MKRLLMDRKGTAEIIGSVMFIVILLFFFTNVYLWHDAATKEMNDLQLQKMNSAVSIVYSDSGVTGTLGALDVSDNGGLDIVLSRLWIIEESASGNHLYANLEPLNVHIAAGDKIQILFDHEHTFTTLNSDGSVYVDPPDQNRILKVYYVLPADQHSVRFVILNTLGLTAADTYSYP